MTCAQFRELVAAFALGALDPDERAACEAHLSLPSHDGYLEALHRARAAAGLLAEALPPRPPREQVWEGILARIREPALATPAVRAPTAPTAPTAPAATALPAPASTPVVALRRPRNALPWALAAAAVVSVIFLGWERFRWADRTRRLEQQMASSEARFRDLERAAVKSLGLESAVKQCQVDLKELRDDAAMRREAWVLFEKPGSRLVTLRPRRGTRYQATAVVNVEEKRGLLWASGLEPMPKHDYTLWWIRGEDRRPAGLLRADAKGDVVVRLDDRLRRDGIPDGLAVTLEPKGGMDQPTGPVVLSGDAR